MKPIDIYEPTRDEVLALRNGMQEPFWMALKKILEGEKHDSEVSLYDEDGVLNQDQREDFRQRRNLLSYVLELPELVIEKSKPKREKSREEDPASDS